jgi:hypothetical protein
MVESSCDPPVKKLEVGLVSEPLDSAEPTAFAGVAEAEFKNWLRKPWSPDRCARPLTTAAIDDWIPVPMVVGEAPKWLASP